MNNTSAEAVIIHAVSAAFNVSAKATLGSAAISNASVSL